MVTAVAPVLRLLFAKGLARRRGIDPPDSGSMLPLAAGLVAFCGVAIIGIVDSTDLALARTTLQSTADMAALVGAESFDPRTATFDGASVAVVLSDRRIRRAVREFLRDSASDARIVRAIALDARTARVTLRANWSPPLGSEFFPNGFLISATASARTVIGG